MTFRVAPGEGCAIKVPRQVENYALIGLSTVRASGESVQNALLPSSLGVGELEDRSAAKAPAAASSSRIVLATGLGAAIQVPGCVKRQLAKVWGDTVRAACEAVDHLLGPAA